MIHCVYFKILALSLSLQPVDDVTVGGRAYANAMLSLAATFLLLNI